MDSDELFVDVLHPKARTFIHNMLETWFKETPLDAVWVDMNEPALTQRKHTCMSPSSNTMY